MFNNNIALFIFFSSTESLTIGKLKNSTPIYGCEMIHHLLDNPLCNPNLKKLAFSNQINSEILNEGNHNFVSNTLVNFIKCFPTLKFIGPCERWSKGFSSSDLISTLSQLQQLNRDVILNYQRHNHSVLSLHFDIQNIFEILFRTCGDLTSSTRNIQPWTI